MVTTWLFNGPVLIAVELLRQATLDAAPVVGQSEEYGTSVPKLDEDNDFKAREQLVASAKESIDRGRPPVPTVSAIFQPA